MAELLLLNFLLSLAGNISAFSYGIPFLESATENAADVIKGLPETVSIHSFVSKLIDLKAEATLFKGSTELAFSRCCAVIVYGPTLRQMHNKK